MDKRIQIFLSYANRDWQLKEELLKHLAPLQKQYQVTIWSADDILPGQAFRDAISQHLDQAQILLFLVSGDFLTSEGCETEIQIALQRQENGTARVIPIILRRVLLPKTFSNLQLLPRNGRPLTEWSSRDLAYLDIVEGIKEIVTEFTSLTTHSEEVWLRKTLQTFSERELRLISFDLGLSPAISVRNTLKGSVDELLAYMKLHNRIQELASYVRKKRTALS